MLNLKILVYTIDGDKRFSIQITTMFAGMELSKAAHRNQEHTFTKLQEKQYVKM